MPHSYFVQYTRSVFGPKAEYICLPLCVDRRDRLASLYTDLTRYLQGNIALSGEFEDIPQIALFVEAGGKMAEGHAKQIIIYDPNLTDYADLHFEARDSKFKKAIPDGFHVRIIGPAKIKFTPKES